MATDCLHSGDLGAHAAHGAAAPSMGDLIAIVGLDLEHGTCNTKKIRMTSDPANRLISVNDVVCAVTGVSPENVARTLRDLFAREPEVRQPSRQEKMVMWHDALLSAPSCPRACSVIIFQ